MFVSTRDQGSTRRSRAYGVNKTARSSRLSVLSSASTSSRGSNATITQDSYSRSQGQDGRARRKRRTHDSAIEPDLYAKSVLERSLGKEKKRSVDVFEFLVDEAVRRSAAEISSDHNSATKQDDNTIESDPECYYRTQHSDSGISMGSSIGDSAIPDSPSSAPLPTLLEDISEHAYSSASSVADCACCQQEAFNWGHYQAGSYLGEHSQPNLTGHTPFLVPSNTFVHLDSDNHATGRESATQSTSTPIIFRDKTGSRSTPRLFRRFKKINSRVLLQMQANIAELEHEIRVMDARDTTTTNESVADTSNHKPAKASRQSRDEQARRTAIYQELRASLDQYYQALVATHQVDLITKTPTTTETQSFHKWVKSHILNSGKTPTFTAEESDLVCFKPPAVRDSPLSTFKIIALSAFINVLIPLIIYKLMSGILNRLIIWSIVIGSGAMTMERLGLKAERIYTTCIIAFGSISLGAALSL